MRKKMKKFLGFMLSFMLVLGLMPSGVTIVKAAEEYPIWIGGIRATTDNCNNLETNHWSFSPKSGNIPATLTLNGYSYEGDGYNYSGVYYGGDDPLTVSFSGNNSITVENGSCKGIYTGGKSVIFSGASDASLTFYAKGANNMQSIYSYGIDAPNISITGGTVTFKGGETYRGYNYGIVNVSQLSIIGGKLIAIGGNETWSYALQGVPASALPDSGIIIEAGSQLDGSDKAECTKNDLADKRYVEITSSVPVKETQTITAADVTATYGDTDKKINATTDGDGTISYAVKSGSENYIEIGADGKMTIKAVPADGKAYVIVTASETAAYEQATKEVTVTISKANAVAATVTANNRTYDGTEKPLVTADEATLVGGNMQYAVGTNATTAPIDGWSISIPAKTDVGTYHVWYKVKADENHLDSDAKCIVATILEKPEDKPDDKTDNEPEKYGKGTIKTGAEIDEDAPKIDNVGNLTTDLAKELMDADEKKAVQNGDTCNLYLKVKKVDASKISEDEKASIVAKAKEMDSDANEMVFLDLSMYMQIGNKERQITDLKNNKISITITIPEDLRAPDGTKRTFFIVRYHEGKSEILAVGTGETITFETDRFSTYALSYTDMSTPVLVRKQKVFGSVYFSRYKEDEVNYKYKFKVDNKSDKKVIRATKDMIRAKNVGQAKVALYRKPRKGGSWEKIEEHDFKVEKPDVKKKVDTLHIDDKASALSFITNEMSVKPTYFNSSKPEVATVDFNTGEIKVLKKGRTTITIAYDNGIGVAKYKTIIKVN